MPLHEFEGMSVDEILQLIWGDPGCIPCSPCRRRISELAERAKAAEGPPDPDLAGDFGAEWKDGEPPNG